MILEPYVNLLREPLAFWASNCNLEKIPDIVHCNGLMPVENTNELTFFIAQAFSEKFIANLNLSPQLSFMGCSVLSFESYQFKGVFTNITGCTPEQIILQQDYVDKFTDVVAGIGYSKDGFYKAYFYQPSYAITFEVTDIFEQTPRKGTGASVITK